MPRAAAPTSRKTPKTPKTAPVATEPAAGGRKKQNKVVDLSNYAPAYLTWIANKLSSGASQAYLAAFDVGIETWRILVLLAAEPALSAQQICKVIGMDKASVSRAFKTMQARGFITIGLDAVDGRLRMASITAEGRAIHDAILSIAMERERVFMSVLDAEERKVLIGMLHRLHDNLPAVERATAKYLEQHYPEARKPKRGVVAEE